MPSSTKAQVNELHIYLSREQSSLLLEALVEQPFKNVFEIIGLLNHQAQPFYQADQQVSAPVLFSLAPADFSVCIKALGELPYNRVFTLVNYLHQQLQTQYASSAQTATVNSTAHGMESTP